MRDDEPDFKPLTAEQAAQLRRLNPQVSPWVVVGVQALVGCGLTLLVWGLTREWPLASSVGYGSLAVVVPAALFARGLSSPLVLRNPGSAVFGFFLWEMVKIALTVAMLFVAPRVLVQLSWPAMLAGLVVTMKVYWVALVWRPKRKV